MTLQNLSEFKSGSDYDAQYGSNYASEINFFLKFISRLGPKPAILDVCCGTGIVTIPLAKAGFDITGIDISSGMISYAREKSLRISTVTFITANALNFNPDQKFELAMMTGNAFQAFLNESDLLQVLDTIRLHLVNGGFFIFDTRLLEGYDVSEDDDYAFWQQYTDESSNIVRHLGKKSRFDSSENILYFDMKRQYPDGSEIETAIDIKFIPFEALLSIMKEAGFKLIDQYADWRQAPFNPSGTHAVFTLQKL